MLQNAPLDLENEFVVFLRVAALDRFYCIVLVNTNVHYNTIFSPIFVNVHVNELLKCL